MRFIDPALGASSAVRPQEYGTRFAALKNAEGPVLRRRNMPDHDYSPHLLRFSLRVGRELLRELFECFDRKLALDTEADKALARLCCL